MTELQTLERKIAQLPDEFKTKLEGYVDALLEEAWTLKHETPQFGDSVELGSNEINGPLDEFKAYSY
ncbi:hypothetical protein BEL04_14410 [Mucilaginibacter sp. PPCGB 2223]|uniref:hypothetical protein n=1 Tax=Mucilaginibacter sp. PPCGB 2223 TaxID=1886027 RepID=UPI000825BA00|nr:hypothetical protein [Mucilaginibacter sp. PPCGB 2223]OCX52636.1 hypothetical protein BEL04_14410 [Mucilaginibacter sp. PPCGB 2223]